MNISNKESGNGGITQLNTTFSHMIGKSFDDGQERKIKSANYNFYGYRHKHNDKQGVLYISDHLDMNL